MAIWTMTSERRQKLRPGSDLASLTCFPGRKRRREGGIGPEPTTATMIMEKAKLVSGRPCIMEV
jgi:hypothetical protein